MPLVSDGPQVFRAMIWALDLVSSSCPARRRRHGGRCRSSVRWTRVARGGVPLELRACSGSGGPAGFSSGWPRAPALPSGQHSPAWRSVSYLHRLFRSQGIAVSSWIRRLRLERARRDLGDPALDAVPIRRIAARWGFNDHATFTRAFRAAYGIAPSDHRRRSLESAPDRAS
ncbi:helix-turn-helix domain-containing protein [Actinomadura sp. LD22]|uniref:Helix-turn-helix domain-containing protein n=1 Tax=Actinomadura physcomitrii TaxID=2650748 RepID=A0A6I4MYI7_9ACTN|nr:helix-turn-helix domain-containing protein [Actinomadura physcomitrii]